MRIVLFYHSMLSDWNHGNAHFLRGIVSELRCRGFEVLVYEPRDSWSFQNLVAEHGEEPVERFLAAYPGMHSVRYDPAALDLNAAIGDADLVLVHEWNTPELVQKIGEHRKERRYRLLFHDTHHRLVTDPEAMGRYDLRHYDGVLAFGEVLRELYLKRGLAQRVWTWHEAADLRVFHPRHADRVDGDLVWIGNWGDDERTGELREFLIEPVKRLGLKARVYGVRYPEAALSALADAGIEYGGWLPNFEAPKIFSRYRMTAHVPRRPYMEALPGIPTIRVFEALACGIPLVSAPWIDAENLFSPGRDYQVARDGGEMEAEMKCLLENPDARDEMAEHGLKTIRKRHTCAHRVDELLEILNELKEEAG